MDDQGHFNQPAAKIKFPSGVMADKWLERAKKQLQIEDQQALYVLFCPVPGWMKGLIGFTGGRDVFDLSRH
jgi:hypothetical protein